MRYEEFYRQSVDEPEVFWAEQARRIHWETPPQRILDQSKPPFRQWFVGGTTNLTAGLQICLKVPRLSTVVVVTDGMPNDQQSALEVATVLKATGVEILVIGTDDADTDFLGRLASRPDLALHVSANQLSSSINDASRMLSAGGITQLPTSKR